MMPTACAPAQAASKRPEWDFTLEVHTHTAISHRQQGNMRRKGQFVYNIGHVTLAVITMTYIIVSYFKAGHCNTFEGIL